MKRQVRFWAIRPDKRWVVVETATLTEADARLRACALGWVLEII